MFYIGNDAKVINMKCKYGCAFKDKGVIRVDDNNNRHILRECRRCGMEEIKISETHKENMMCDISSNGLHQLKPLGRYKILEYHKKYKRVSQDVVCECCGERKIVESIAYHFK
jgi:hypothetical protein